MTKPKKRTKRNPHAGYSVDLAPLLVGGKPAGEG